MIELKEKKILVLGLGQSGIAAANLLLSKGAHVFIWDNRDNDDLRAKANKLKTDGVNVSLKNDDKKILDFHFAVISPGLAHNDDLVLLVAETGIEIIAEIELAYRLSDSQIIAITGTNGKSTTTMLIDYLLKTAGMKSVACGNIGLPFCDVIRRGEFYDFIVLEVSSFQLETIVEFKPKIAIYLNFSGDHQDRYDSLEEYKEAKNRIFLKQKEEDYAIVNADLDLPVFKSQSITFSSNGCDADYQYFDKNLVSRGTIVCRQEDTTLMGLHNAENQLCALAVSEILEIKQEKAVQALRTYSSLPHRCEIVAVKNGVTFINDSKATNLDALEKALMSQDQPVILIAGGKNKGSDFSSIKKLVLEKVKKAILIGEIRDEIRSHWENEISCESALLLNEAVIQAWEGAKENDVVLFSPGTSSFDMFQGFEERGEKFKQIVNEL